MPSSPAASRAAPRAARQRGTPAGAGGLWRTGVSGSRAPASPFTSWSRVTPTSRQG